MRIPFRPKPAFSVGGLSCLIAVAFAQCGPTAQTSDPAAVSAAPYVMTTLPATPDTSLPAPPMSTAPPTTAPPTTAPPTTAPPSTAPATTVAAPVTTAPAPPPPPPAAPAPPPPAPPPAATVAQAPPAPVDTPPPAPEPPATEPPPPPPDPDPPAAPSSDAVALANAERAAAGLPPLAESGALTDAARSHSIDQASMQTMTHSGSDGSDAGQRIARAGFAAGTWGENVAAGYGSASAVIGGWMGSSGHRRNILNPAFDSIGVASAQASDGTLYWTMVLAG